MANFVIRPATPQDVETVYGHPPPRTMRALAGVVDGTTVAVGGVYYYPDQVVAFSKVLPDYQDSKIGIARGALCIRKLLDQINVPVLAIAEPDIPSAPDLLERLGFQYLMTNSQGKVFVWRKH